MSRMLMDLPVRRLPTSRDLLICSTSHSNKLAYSDFAKASRVSMAYKWSNQSEAYVTYLWKSETFHKNIYIVIRNRAS